MRRVAFASLFESRRVAVRFVAGSTPARSGSVPQGVAHLSERARQRYSRPCKVQRRTHITSWNSDWAPRCEPCRGSELLQTASTGDIPQAPREIHRPGRCGAISETLGSPLERRIKRRDPQIVPGAGAMSKLMLWVIRAYQIVFAPLFLPSCRFAPSCSEYAKAAILKHGAIVGGWLAVRRVLRCHPWHAGGFDPVP